ncbi:signal transduction protein [Aliivibrio salmonicida]|uniref:Signal transduction protein, histidine kinase n=1 Tax=Aliivibrio salmonicida (strain LFI1238) TaxID=316275 RepID=B6ERC5_ALISL|nr:ATP-binding protein [Aliivibrio salmonicida]AZL86637.1 signal transduction protein [Aliivibrio salmonicida]CAQ81258.1 signal transduction protein, histidine kinase [Aliivibrio salmonicida LFI1238]
MANTDLYFKTRARTIDHLGREQIADCPTAISELWKNAYDADADEVALHILDGEKSIAAIVDNGFGMNASDFEEKWLTVGTESKIESLNSNEQVIRKYNRQKQGQKGIGRLSCAALGHLLLLISKAEGHPFVVSLIDWRLFENPFIMLHDISIPVAEVVSIEELYGEIVHLCERLLFNVTPTREDNSARASRLRDAWKMYAEYEINEQKKQNSELIGFKSTHDLIIEQTNSSLFTERVVRTWQVANDTSSTGTAMFMVGIPDDLEDQLVLESIQDVDDATARAKLKLLETLSNFTDPFVKPKEKKNDPFLTSVTAWNGQLQRELVSDIREFDISDLEQMEHLVDGHVDEEGYFRGTIKAFGQVYENQVIKPKQKYRTRIDSRFGAFDIRIGGFEGQKNRSSMPETLWNNIQNKSDLHGGLRIYRDGLRVMPYGRDDSDFFEIEKRRTNNAGRYFWSSRKTYGRISISRLGNPNLKDKAGREGLLDNRAAMLFREIIIGILIQTAEQYFGRKSDIRQEALEDIAAQRAEEKAKLDRKKLLRNERNRVKKGIQTQQPELSAFLDELEELQADLAHGEEIINLQQAKELKGLSNKYNEKLKSFSLSPVPPSLGTIKENYEGYRSLELRSQEITRRLNVTADTAINKYITKTDTEVAKSQLNTNRGYITAKVKKLALEGRTLLKSELERFEQLVTSCNKAYDIALSEVMRDLELGKLTSSEAMKQIDDEYQKQEINNEQALKPYVTALNSIKNAIDLEGLAIESLRESNKWQQEATRLNGLAQLGITVEIIGHEIEGLDITMARGISDLRKTHLNDVQNQLVDSVDFAHQSLSDKWRFLTPLKLSGEHTKTNVTGLAIIDYVRNFYGDSLAKRNISLTTTSSFEQFNVHDSPARLYPVFINLINNSRYWLNIKGDNVKEICLDYKNGEVVIADNGPGVDLVDLERLFTLFFTKKQRGGRGVGLYLSKSNLALSGHTIRYITNDDEKSLNGANFAIKIGGLLK